MTRDVVRRNEYLSEILPYLMSVGLSAAYQGPTQLMKRMVLNKTNTCFFSFLVFGEKSRNLAASSDQHRGPSGSLAIENTVGQQHRSFARMDLFHKGQRFRHNASIMAYTIIKDKKQVEHNYSTLIRAQCAVPLPLRIPSNLVVLHPSNPETGAVNDFPGWDVAVILRILATVIQRLCGKVREKAPSGPHYPLACDTSRM